MALLSLFTAGLQIPTVILSYMYSNLEQYGKKFVFLTRLTEPGGIKDTLGFIVYLSAPLLFSMWNFHHTFGVFGN